MPNTERTSDPVNRHRESEHTLNLMIENEGLAATLHALIEAVYLRSRAGEGNHWRQIGTRLTAIEQTAFVERL